MPTLRVIHRSSVLAGRELTLQHPVIRLGRDPGSQVLFDEVADRSVSRNHAEIRWEASGPVLYPVAGKIVLIRDQPINVPTPLKSGDILEMAGPGGPSVEVQFDLAPQVGTQAQVDSVAATVFEMNPSALAGVGAPVAPAPQAPALAAAPPAEPPKPSIEPPKPAVAPPRPSVEPPKPAVAPPRPSVEPPRPAAPAPPGPERPNEKAKGASPWVDRPQAVGLPELPASKPPPKREQAGTAFIPALDAEALAQLDRKQAPLPVQARSRRNLAAAIAVGVLVLAVAGGGAAWWSAREREERIRLAVQRVEALIDAEESSGVVPEVSEEDMRLFEEEVKANRHAPSPVALHQLKALRTPKKKVPKVPSVDSRPDDQPVADAAPKRQSVRAAFAAYQRAQIARLTEGNPKDKTHLKELIEEVRKAEAAYEETVKGLALPPGDETDAVLRSTVRYLGECDALMPDRFRTQARQYVEAIRTDKPKRDKLVRAVKRAADFRYAPTITAALADQGLPVELFFIPLRMSGFDERRVELPTPQGIPKGMWALLPGPAKDLGLSVGKAKDSLDADPTDDRQHYEREVKKIARGMRLVFLKKAAGSSLLFMSTWDHGDTELLSRMKEKAGLEPNETDPEKVSFWKLWEAGKLTDEVKSAALEYVATAAIADNPTLFGFSFDPPLKHVSLADRE